ncbi:MULTISPECIES: hypothetical protein [unclassified Actinobaculum]|uniref:hypothetical protein n=1 Tax=unclassified Actinobaculum TaxID=2609299 RepID=UPI0013DDA93F|nr:MULTISPECIES: hypothetical protein [unclassified Actinobaculum]
MYAAIWRHLPGPRWLKALEAIIIVAAIVVALFTWVYPWAADTFLPDLDNTVG